MTPISLYNDLKRSYATLLKNHTTTEIDKKIAELKEGCLKIELPLTALRLQERIVCREENLREGLTLKLRKQLLLLHCETTYLGMEQCLFPLLFSLGRRNGEGCGTMAQYLEKLNAAVSGSEIELLFGIDYNQVNKMFRRYENYFKQFMKYCPLLLEDCAMSRFAVRYMQGIEQQLAALDGTLRRFYENNLVVKINHFEEYLGSLTDSRDLYEGLISQTDRELSAILLSGIYVTYCDHFSNFEIVFELGAFHLAMAKETDQTTADDYVKQIRNNHFSKGKVTSIDLLQMGRVHSQRIVALFSHQDDNKAGELMLLKRKKRAHEAEFASCCKKIEKAKLESAALHRHSSAVFDDAIRENEALQRGFEHLGAMLAEVQKLSGKYAELQFQ